ncbi:hypothetical protein [Arthrobacter sp. MAHUQ-56]
MHPLAAIGLVILSGLAWLGTILTLLVSVAKARRRSPLEPGRPPQGTDVRSAGSKASRPL